MVAAGRRVVAPRVPALMRPETRMCDMCHLKAAHHDCLAITYGTRGHDGHTPYVAMTVASAACYVPLGWLLLYITAPWCVWGPITCGM
jgi:hypothetical protein